jgi:hypothetical protein
VKTNSFLPQSPLKCLSEAEEVEEVSVVAVIEEEVEVEEAVEEVDLVVNLRFLPIQWKRWEFLSILVKEKWYFSPLITRFPSSTLLYTLRISNRSEF